MFFVISFKEDTLKLLGIRSTKKKLDSRGKHAHFENFELIGKKHAYFENFELIGKISIVLKIWVKWKLAHIGLLTIKFFRKE